jgi:integrase/recombinase XerD
MYNSDMAYQYKREPLTPEEMNRLTNACETHQQRLIVWTLLDTGLRVGELAALTREGIDWQGKRLAVFGKGGPFGARSKRRVVPLSPRVYTLLAEHFAVADSLGATTRTVERIIKRVANRAAIKRPTTPHVLRHTFAVTAIQKGISLPALQRLLGHDRLATTEIYLNLSPEHVIDEFRAKW